jgi:hypothetical protein
MANYLWNVFLITVINITKLKKTLYVLLVDLFESYDDARTWERQILER